MDENIIAIMIFDGPGPLGQLARPTGRGGWPSPIVGPISGGVLWPKTHARLVGMAEAASGGFSRLAAVIGVTIFGERVGFSRIDAV